MHRYEKIGFSGEGQFSMFFKAKDRETGRTVAVKKIKVDIRTDDTANINKEIKLLRELKHPNLIDLLDICSNGNNTVNLVYEYMSTDLEDIIKDRENIVLTPSHVKAYMIMMLSGLEYLHSNWILHRDLKPNNLFIDEKGLLKIGDFSLPKFHDSPLREMTNSLVKSRWYKAPELLYGDEMYSYGIDIWAAGCIFAELLRREPFLPGESDLSQLNKIFEVFGTPNESDWPNVRTLPGFVEFKPCYPKSLKTIFNGVTQDLLFVIETMLQLNPNKRCTCREALSMPYFSSAPYATSLDQLPQPQNLTEQFKNRSDNMGVKNACKRKILDDASGIMKKFKNETVF